MCQTSPDSIMSSFNSIPQKLINCDSMDSVRKSPVSTIGSTVASMPHCESFLDLTPSPSDSGISELEAALRDRDSELAYLRQTMEHNEQVIFRVYQEKEKIWERELRKLKNVQETRLRASAQKVMKLEQTLMMQSYQLQQDKKKFNEEIQKVNCENNKLRKEMALLRERLDETEWNLCQKTGELSLLKSQLKDYQNEQTCKGQEIIQLKAECRDTQNELIFYKSENQQLKMLLAAKDTEIEKHKKENELTRNKTDKTNRRSSSTTSVSNDSRLNENFKERKEKPPDITVLSCDDGQLVNAKWHYIFDDDCDEGSATPTTFHLNRYCSCAEINKLMEQISLKEKHFEKERLTWAHEKEKVLRYQRQLQMDYIQMFKRTKNLENEVENLTIEVELQKNNSRKYPLVDSKKQTINL
ncbi:leucine zipper putative tumor suppressor 2 homolog [Agrilus planipennis]|uniref:Leucine zipper putative tumor suppressor 2 homolog n=1 Tax=Agrilus planipennis TaxID=224129 RepID=A0A7F5REC9_AGRPL|nr:leucine zipper putative tumor suppressor 2 homolog [Agrilus planipennis]